MATKQIGGIVLEVGITLRGLWPPLSPKPLHSLGLTGEQSKALVTQLTLFNQILGELRDDIREQV